MSAATHSLQPHPATPCAAVEAISVTVAFDPASGLLRLAYALAGDLARLRVPAAATQLGPADELWRHTCFEAFIGPDDAPDYREFNFAPSGHWAAYAFSAERVPAPAPAIAPRIVCERNAHALTLEALLPLQASGSPLRLGLSAVIETADGALSYWALAHPAARPDFHRRDGWTLRLEPF